MLITNAHHKLAFIPDSAIRQLLSISKLKKSRNTIVLSFILRICTILKIQHRAISFRVISPVADFTLDAIIFPVEKLQNNLSVQLRHFKSREEV